MSLLGDRVLFILAVAVSLSMFGCFLAAALRCVQDLRDELQNLGCVISLYSLMNHTTRSEPHVLLD